MFRLILFVGVFRICVRIRPTCVPVLQKSEEGIEPLQLKIRCYEPPCGFWKLNLSPLQEEAVLFATDPPLWPQDSASIHPSFFLLLIFFETGF